MINAHLYQATSLEDWQGRIDGDRIERFHQVIQILDLNQKNCLHKFPKRNFALLGFCCDAGVIRNQGRPGAKEGPQALRKMLSSLPLHHELTIYDAGNIICEGDDLEAAQQQLGSVTEQLTQAGLNVIVLGGGHEVAWGHYQGIAKTTTNKKLGIINFDAHFDLRPLANNKGSSGTPFLQVANARGHDNFHYCCVGIQDTANTPSLFKQAKALNVNTIHADEFHNDLSAVEEKLKTFSEPFDTLYVTVCMDVFAHAIAPGVSAPQANGLFAHHVIHLIKLLARQNKPVYFDIAELSPCHDVDNQTARLAAACLYQFIATYQEQL
jgi:formiminoglutamase